jgi:hypothetical protein
MKINMSSMQMGGLGFLKSKDFNYALLFKLAWMVASYGESVCMNLLRCKYKMRGDWLRKPFSKMASPIWKAIEKAKK